ncbi:MAG: M48 family metallopeptidase [Kiloniellales bacterium]
MPYAGSYNDGQTAARHEVSVTLEAEGLRIDAAEGQRLEFWPYGELCLVDEILAGRPLRLKCGERGEARLTVDDHRILAELSPHAPQLRPGRTRVGVLRALVLGLAGAAVLGLVVWIVLPRMARLAAQWIPVSWEEALGERVLAQTVEIFSLMEEGEARFCAAGPGRAALDGLTDRLAAAGRSPYRFRVLVLDMKIPNAFALPGGYVVLFRGLIEEAQGPEEVAGILAHEMGHVMHRHGTQMLIRNMGLGILLELGGAGDGVLGTLGETLVGLSYSREAEAEADTAALDLLRETGIGAQGLAAFFERLREKGFNMEGALQLLSTHPSHESRARLFEGAAGGGGPGMSPADWEALQGICAK